MDGEKSDIIGLRVKTGGEKLLNVLPKADEAVIPIEKFINYALDPIRSRGKSVAFSDILGYTKDNVDLLTTNIRQNLKNFPAENKGDKGYGATYAVLMELTGANGKTANVMTAWLDDNKTGQMRLISAYIKRRKGWTS
ncbi:MAG: hypothetical protein LBR98_06690 [Syntrophomonadaceae bacterium]|nr:hypothetical protein [Syntrophomonadaceae bacterium]